LLQWLIVPDQVKVKKEKENMAVNMRVDENMVVDIKKAGRMLIMMTEVKAEAKKADMEKKAGKMIMLTKMKVGAKKADMEKKAAKMIMLTKVKVEAKKADTKKIVDRKKVAVMKTDEEATLTKADDEAKATAAAMKTGEEKNVNVTAFIVIDTMTNFATVIVSAIIINVRLVIARTMASV